MGKSIRSFTAVNVDSTISFTVSVRTRGQLAEKVSDFVQAHMPTLMVSPETLRGIASVLWSGNVVNFGADGWLLVEGLRQVTSIQTQPLPAAFQG